MDYPLRRSLLQKPYGDLECLWIKQFLTEAINKANPSKTILKSPDFLYCLTFLFVVASYTSIL